jgi:crotonobetainyl-CoA:carnitine CoA-transferase CaiB-like acyl-CoA transferase
VIETQPPGRLEALGAGYEQLRALNPRLIWISITPFGQTGPYQAYRGSDLIAMAMSGLMSLLGEPGRPPLRVSLPQAPMWAAMYAVGGALIAHHHRQASGHGQQVDISLQAGLLWALANAPAFWSTNRTVPRRAGQQVTGRSLTGAVMRAIYPCKDGFLNFIIYGGDAGRRSNEALVAWLAEEGLAGDGLLHKDWSRFNIATSTQAEIDELERPTAELFRRYTKAEFLDQAFRRDMLGYPVADARDILDDPHLEARGFWQPLAQPALGRRVKYPGRFARVSAAGAGPCRPAPGLAEHNAEIYQGELGLSPADVAALRAGGVL